MPHSLPAFGGQQPVICSGKPSVEYPTIFRSGALALQKTRRRVIMTFSNPSFLIFLEEQRADYRRSLPERLVQIESLWRQVLNDEAPAPAPASLERCAHSLAGSGATFGFAVLGDAARVLELAVSPLLGTTHALTPVALSEVSRAVEALQRSLSGETGIQGA